MNNQRKVGLLSALLFSSLSGVLALLIKTDFFPSVYEIWWPGFNYSNSVTGSDKNDYSKIPRLRGNAQGIIEKLPYIKSLGVDYVWITPFFQSPQLDNGYDVSDYYKIDPLFGTAKDVELLIQKADDLGLKIMVDLVMNHTSNEHEWFRKAIVGDKEFLTYYWIFKDTGRRNSDKLKTPIVENPYKLCGWDPFGGKSTINLPWYGQKGLNDNDSVPINITSYRVSDYTFKDIEYQSNKKKVENTAPYGVFEIAGEKYFYLHTFSGFQPDLNWNNPTVRKEMIKVANFWINKGVKGFRLDAIPLIGKDISDKSHLLIPNRYQLEEMMNNFRNDTYGPKNLFTIGELSQARAGDNDANNLRFASKFFDTAYLPLDSLWSFVNEYNGRGLWQMPTGLKHFGTFFDQSYQGLDEKKYGITEPSFLESQYVMNSYSEYFGPSLLMENHDQPRSVSRFSSLANGSPWQEEVYGRNGGNKKIWLIHQHEPTDVNHTDFRNRVLPRAKALALFKFFQQGVPIIYQGQEIGMDNYPFYYGEEDKTLLNGTFLKSVDLQVSQWIIKARFNHFFDDIVTHSPEYALASPSETGRDSTRTPIQWDSERNAGWGSELRFLERDDFSDKEKWDSWKKFIDSLEQDRFDRDYLVSIFLDKRKIYDKEWLYTSAVFGKTKEEIGEEVVYKGQIRDMDLRTNIYPLLLNPHYKQINVQEQEQRLDSPLNFYRKLLYLRKTNSVLNHGSFKALTEGKDFKVLNHNEYDQSMTAAYTRSNFWGTKKYLVITNLDYQARLININLGNYLTYDRLLLNTHSGLTYQNNLLELQPYQGIVVRI